MKDHPINNPPAKNTTLTRSKIQKAIACLAIVAKPRQNIEVITNEEAATVRRAVHNSPCVTGERLVRFSISNAMRAENTKGTQNAVTAGMKDFPMEYPRYARCRRMCHRVTTNSKATQSAVTCISSRTRVSSLGSQKIVPALVSMFVGGFKARD